jgi:50S ribosomal protein L16 3-hydroxylase
MILQELLGDTPVSQFIENYYLKLPFARPGGCGALTHLADWGTIDRILAQPNVDALVGRGGQQWPGGRTPTVEEGRRLFAEGYTIGIRQAHKHDAELAELAKRFAEALGGVVDVQLYATPANQPGFGWHYDPEEVFVLQLSGDKEWHLRRNTVHPWPLIEAIPADQRYERELMPLMRCTLAPGDWLYIPGGWWHRTQAGVESISLSVGVLAPTALNAFDALRPRLMQSLQWRQRLPCAGAAAAETNEELVRRHQELFAELGHDLAREMAREEFARAFLDRNNRNK